MRLVSPASTPSRDGVARGVELLESWGLRVEVGRHAFDEHGYLAGDDHDRLADLNEAFRDPGVRAVLATRGGKGAYRIADRIWLTADGAVGYNLLNDRLQRSAAFAAGGDSFVTTAFSQSPWLYSAGVGLASQRADNLDLSMRYGLQTSPSGFLNQTGSFTLRIKL